VQSGLGTYTYPDGGRYVGEWYASAQTGLGTYTFPDGRRYVGEWMWNTRHGQGSLFSSNQRLIQNGVWEGDRFVRANNLRNPVPPAQGSPTRPPR
jgi:hypothetical protein